MRKCGLPALYGAEFLLYFSLAFILTSDASNAILAESLMYEIQWRLASFHFMKFLRKLWTQ